MLVIKKYFSYGFVIAIVSYLAYWYFWPILSYSKTSFSGIDFYHHKMVSKKNLERLAIHSINLVEASELFQKEQDRKYYFSVYLTSGYGEYASLVMKSYRSFAVSFPIFQRIIVTRSNVSKNKVYRNGKLFNTRSLNSVLAHEMVHVLTEKEIGFFKYRFMPVWKREGYADYIANESSFDEVFGKELFCSGKINQSLSYKYFKFRMLIKYLMESEKLSFHQIMDQKFDVSQLEKNSKLFICKI